ncbi:cysteine hydrolase family protein [Chitinophaga sp. NPDC101104]|uniref:cysteine hydrolase family protein n=1 Tax=Chitinophaga sp. NPDC101104 TaxID=3390561 RepID=UPI003D011D71
MKLTAFWVAFISITSGVFAQRPANNEHMKEALIIIDIQQDYFPGGRHTLVGAEEAAEKAKQVLAHFRKTGRPVIHVQHISTNEGATLFLPGTDGIAIHGAVMPENGEKIITKHFPNSFRETDLLEYLKANGIQRLTFAGMMTHVCIDASVKAARDFGFDCTVVADACATLDVEVQGKKVPAAWVQQSLLGALEFFYAEIKTAAEVVAH